MTWSPNLPLQIEQEKIKYEIVPYTRGRVLNLGCGLSRGFPHFVGIDNMQEWPEWATHTPDMVMDCESLDLFMDKSVDAVFSSWLLQYFTEPEKVLKEWWRVIRDSGHLVLYLPHRRFYPNINQPGFNPYHKQDFLPEDIVSIMEGIGGWDLVINEERNEDQEYSFLQVYRKQGDEIHDFSHKKQKPEKTCLIVRYGGAGDMLQTSSVLPLLKEQGYHITLNTSERGYDIVKFDPNIDEFIIQGSEQVPNPELGPYWKVLRRKYDKFINFSESVEGSLLALPDRMQFQWCKEARHRLLNVNYLEFMHSLADVPYVPQPKFYAHESEKWWAKKQKDKIKGRVVLWVLSGSSVHKTWPYLDQTIARFMVQYPDVSIVFCGDAVSGMLEAGWEKEPRVIMTCGKWTMRNSLTFAECADLVIGPETGVMNGVSMIEKIPKIVCLSHSSIENLTRDWKNTVSLMPEGCKCYPCHQLHQHGFDGNCPRDEHSGVSLCQAKIDVEVMWQAIKDRLHEI